MRRRNLFDERSFLDRLKETRYLTEKSTISTRVGVTLTRQTTNKASLRQCVT